MGAAFALPVEAHAAFGGDARRIKEKTGCKRLPELIRWLNDLRLPLRRDR